MTVAGLRRLAERIKMKKEKMVENLAAEGWPAAARFIQRPKNFRACMPAVRTADGALPDGQEAAGSQTIGRRAQRAAQLVGGVADGMESSRHLADQSVIDLLGAPADMLQIL